MYVGTQYFGTSRHEMEFLARHGVTHFDASVDGWAYQFGYIIALIQALENEFPQTQSF